MSRGTDSARAPRIYLAGPEVFLPDVEEIARRKQALCARHGFDGVFPLDALLNLTGLSPYESGLAIARANEGLIRRCDLLIANMTPFRGPSMDVGTAYEMGVMRGLGRPVFGYCNTTENFQARTVRHAGGRRDGSRWVDASGLTIEEFDMVDNLMLEGAVRDSGGRIAVASVPEGELFSNLTAFEACLEQAKAPPSSRE